MNRPYIDRAIKLLDNLGSDIPFIDTLIERLIYVIGKHFGKVEVSVKNGVIDIISKKDTELMK